MAASTSEDCSRVSFDTSRLNSPSSQIILDVDSSIDCDGERRLESGVASSVLAEERDGSKRIVN